MKEVKVDVLVIGDIACRGAVSCHEVGGVGGLYNTFEITTKNIPESVTVSDIRYDLRNVIIMESGDEPLWMTNLYAPSGKSVLATGTVSMLAIK